jgi:hypothetical protein
MSSRPAWGTEQDPVSIKTKHNNKNKAQKKIVVGSSLPQENCQERSLFQ